MRRVLGEDAWNSLGSMWGGELEGQVGRRVGRSIGKDDSCNWGHSGGGGNPSALETSWNPMRVTLVRTPSKRGYRVYTSNVL